MFQQNPSGLRCRGMAAKPSRTFGGSGCRGMAARSSRTLGGSRYRGTTAEQQNPRRLTPPGGRLQESAYLLVAG